MKVSVIAANQLTTEHVDAWHALQNGVYEHPFFSPEYVSLVADVHEGARVAVVEHDSQLGFFPFQTDGGRTGRPIGERLTDFQGPVFPAQWRVDMRELLRRCRLNVWRFDHLISSNDAHNASIQTTAGSPWMDLSRGFDAYVKQVRASGSSAVKQTERKARKMERELGPLRLELHDRSSAAYERLLEWKTAYIRAKGAFPLLETPWVLELLDRVQGTESDWLTGRMSVLYAGDQIAAVHLGLGSRRIFHWWITSYDVNLHRYSPGTILLLRLARTLAEQGVQRIELGKGDEPYKKRLMTDEHVLGEGAFTRTRSRHWLERARQHYRSSLRDSALSPLVQKSKQLVRYSRLAKE